MVLFQTLDSRVQPLILVSSIPPTSAGLMLSRSFVSRGNRTCSHTDHIMFNIMYFFYFNMDFSAFHLHVSSHLVEAGLPLCRIQGLQIVNEQRPLEVGEGLHANLSPGVTAKPRDSWRSNNRKQ